jgi:hypothetical protein
MSDQGEFDKDGHFKTGIGTEHLIVGAQQELAEARERILVLESELEVARSLTKEALDQIAVKDADLAMVRAELDQAVGCIEDIGAELSEARAQIAAKDAALRAVLKEVLYIHGRGGLGLNVHEVMDGWVGTIDAALAAKETDDEI